jgi:hypothetical protein
MKAGAGGDVRTRMRRLRRILAGCLAVAACAGVASAGPEQVEVTRLPEPQWLRAASAGAATVRLRLVSARPNEITDVDAWFARNRLSLPTVGPLHLPAGTPRSFRSLPLLEAIRRRDTLLLVYGRHGRYLVGQTGAKPRYALDFVNYAYAPRGPERSFQELLWAVEGGGVLYVAHAHATYARASGGLTGYVTAIDVRTRTVRWRSRPLVANAETFEVVGNVIVAGYGFTEEADFLYLLDRRTGAVVQRLALPSAPEYVIRRGRTVYVRTYDHDVIVRLEPRR